MGYVWSVGARLSGDADAVGFELESIAAREPLTPEAVVRAARLKRSALHTYIFDGTTADDALREYRLQRAKYLLRSIEIVEGGSEEIEVRGFQVVVIDGEREYVSSLVAKDDPDLRSQIRDRLLRDLISMKKRLRAWDEFAAVVAEIERLAA